MRKISILLFLSCIAVLLIFKFYAFEIESNFLNISLSLITFLFSIFLAFSIADRHGRIEKIIESDSMERSQLLSLYHHSKVYGKDFSENMKKAIIDYLMATIDYKIEDYYKTEKEFNAIGDLVVNLSLKGDKQQVFYSYFVEMLNNARIARLKTLAVIEGRLSRFEWFIYISLSLSIILILILLNVGDFISILISVVLSIITVMFLTLLYKLDDLSWKYESKILEPYEKTFEALGELRYYPKDFVTSGLINQHKGKKYMVAIYPNPYPDMLNKKIEIIDETANK